MTEHFSFFDAIQDSNGHYDREYNAQQFTDYFKSLVTTGVMKGAYNQLEVTANGSNMTSSVKSGVAFVEGRYYYNDALLQLTHDTEVIGLSRIDRIVVRMDLSTEARYVKTFIKKGVPAASPTPPVLTQTQQLYEISLAQVRVVGGQTFIAVNAITDERGKVIICPWAGSNILPNFSDSSLGQPNGIAMLDEDGDVPLSQLNKVPLPQDATTGQKGIVQLNDTLTSTAINQAATPNAVKQVNDKFKLPSVINATKFNGWGGPVYMTKDNMGVVYLDMAAIPGVRNADTKIFSFPTGYGPINGTGYFYAEQFNSSGESVGSVRLYALDDGLYLQNAAQSSATTLICTVSWRAE